MTDAWMPGAQRLPAAADGGGLKGGAPRAVWLVLHADPITLSPRDAAERLIELGRPCHLVWNPLSGEVAQLIPVVRAGRALGWADGPHWGPGSAGPRSAGPGWAPGPGTGRPGWGREGVWAEDRSRVPGTEADGQDRAADSGWMQPGVWAQNHERALEPGWTRDPDRAPGAGSTHGADWTPGIGWTHGSGARPMVVAAGPPPEEPVTPPARDGLAGVNSEGRVCVQIGVIGREWMPFTTGPVRRAREIVSWLDSWHVPRGWPAGPPAPLSGPAGPGQQRRRYWARGGHFGASQVPGCRGAGPGAIDIEQLTGPLISQRGADGPCGPGSPARISAMTWQPRLTAARSAAP